MKTLYWKVDTPALLKEIATGALAPNMGVLKAPLNIFQNLLGQVSERAIELDDPELNVLMLRLNFYDVPHAENQKAILKQQKRIKEKV